MGLGQWRKFGERLRQMDRAERRDRFRQEFHKRQDALLSRLGVDFVPKAPAAGTIQRRRFFFDPNGVDSLLELLRVRLPRQVEQIVQQADKVCRHRFDLLGFRDLDFGSPIDWHVDPVHGKRARRRAFYKVRYLDFAEVGDSKIIWELNRHQHFVTLAKAFRLTGDDRYADELLRQWRHWQAENPYPIGINWASSLECAFRSLSWLWSYHLLESSPRLPRLREEWLRGLALHGRHIERYLSKYFSPNTHLLGEGVALFFLGVLCPELAQAERWKALGWDVVVGESARQVRADGFYFEQSTYYHVYALDMFLHSAVLASVNGMPIPASFEAVIEKMLSALYLLSRGGLPPRFGDDDGGRLFDGQRNRSEHLLDPLATGAILFHGGDFKSLATALREETIWLLGAEGVKQWDELEAVSGEDRSAALSESGYYRMSAGPSAQLVVDAGLQGTQSGGHGHADALSVCVQSRGCPLLIDPGTLEYVGEGRDRDLFRGTGMHNTLRVDGLDQAEAVSAFSWRRLTQGKAEQWIQGTGFELLVASHDGYQRLAEPVTHRRWVLSLKNGMFLVRDRVEGHGKHRLEVAWHLGQDMQMVEPYLFRCKGASQGLALLPAQGQGWAEEVRKESWSPVYGQKAPMTVLKFGTVTAVPAEFAVLLRTLEEVHDVPGILSRMKQPDSDGPVAAYRYSGEGGEYQICFAVVGKPWKQESLASDAEFVCWRGSADLRLMMCNGTYVEIDGREELRCRRPVSWCELVVEGGQRNVRCSDPEALEIDQPAAASNVGEPVRGMSE